MSGDSLVILGSNRESTKILYHALSKQFKIDAVIIEESIPISRFLRRRIRRLGLSTVLGQLIFKLSIEPILKLRSGPRIAEIKELYGLCDDPIPADKTVHVPCVNSDEARTLLSTIRPDVVVISGTRIIGRKTLTCIDTCFVNIHAGITPRYRGVHGGYWALYNRDVEHCGVTVHIVDPGIDTGDIISQSKITPTEKDNFVTYPLLQLATGIPLLVEAIIAIFENRLRTYKIQDSPSRLWSHPTAWQYLKGWLLYGVK